MQRLRKQRAKERGKGETTEGREGRKRQGGTVRGDDRGREGFRGAGSSLPQLTCMQSITDASPSRP
eukprot:754898-Hanusia_phi.AAC.1